MKAILKNGHVIDPSRDIDQVMDIAINGDTLVEPSTLQNETDVEIFDVNGMVVCPGLIDIHVHLREPGLEYKEDIATGTAAAAAGGVTTIMNMPNTKPAIDSVETVALFQKLVEEKAVINVLTAPALTVKRGGKELVDFETLADMGIAAFTDDGNCIPERALMKEAMEICKKLGYVIVDHCEDREVWNSGVIRQGPISELMKVPGQPPETELNIIRRNIELARETGCWIHMQHITLGETVELVRQAKKEGLPVSAEVCPHHFTFTYDDIPSLGTNAKMNPPLGSAEDRRMLLEGVADGTIEIICTDHAPHAPFEKADSLVRAPFGIIGLETLLPVSLTQLYHTGLMPLYDVIERMTAAPARLLNLDTGTLTPGKWADITVFDPNAEYVIDINASKSKSRNSPFHGVTVKGKVMKTICAGELVYSAD